MAFFVMSNAREVADWFTYEGSGFCFILDEEMNPQIYFPTQGMYDPLFRTLIDEASQPEVCYG
ncbi:MAG: hypothetical protein UZ21_OP11001000796 [Microgenomates bacterium OLB22]|nr:MAG: hypothetical protein UZ21_OP11001000796 [Microgenomates bacterium OLB22]